MCASTLCASTFESQNHFNFQGCPFEISSLKQVLMLQSAYFQSACNISGFPNAASSSQLNHYVNIFHTFRLNSCITIFRQTSALLNFILVYFCLYALSFYGNLLDNLLKINLIFMTLLLILIKFFTRTLYLNFLHDFNVDIFISRNIA